MKADFTDVNETRKNVRVEIPSDVVDKEIDHITSHYSKRARIPGFRPGKAPARVIKKRFKEQILSEVAQELVPRAVDDALREKGVEAVDTPDVRDVFIEEGQPLTFTASFETLPSFDPGDYSTLALRQPRATIDDAAVAEALERLRTRAARFEPVEGRGVDHGDTVVVDLVREGTVAEADAQGASGSKASRDQHENVSIELGSAANPPGFDEQLLGLEPGAHKAFSIRYPADYAISELAGAEVHYIVDVKSIKRRVMPELDDEFAKDLGEFENLDALRTRIRQDLQHEAHHAAEHQVRADLLKQLAARVPFEVPGSLVDREIDRRLEEFATRLMDQGVDPRKASIDWKAFRESQRQPAVESVASTIVLDEAARREQIVVSDEEVEGEIARYAERAGQTPAALRARLDKEGGVSRIQAGLRREKAIDFLIARAKILGE